MNATPNHDTLDNAITSDASLARINHDDENDPESQQDEASLHDDDPSLIAPTADIGRGVSQFITAMQQGGMSSTLDPSLASVQEGASSATPVDQQRFRPLKSRKAQHFLLGVLFLATTGVLVAFFLVLFKNQKSLSNAKRTTEPPRKDAPPTPPPRPNRQAHLEAITSLLETSGLATPSSFLEPTSPRTRALDWLVYQDQTLTRLDTAAHKHRLLQRYTLILFAFSTGVELWQTINPWIEMVQTQECSFAGIDCNSEGQVVGMQLPYWRLSGTLPDELGLVLTNMTSLVMNHNKLDGTIPETLFQLTHLHTLILYDNNLESTISSSIGRLTDLKSLYLGNNRFTGSLPITSLQALTQMREFLLSRNQVEGPVMDAILSWKYLQSLGLSELPYIRTTFPSEIGQLTHLSDLVLGVTNPGLPTEIGHLTKLKVLYMLAPPGGDDGLTSTIPTEIGRLTSLEEFTMNGKHLITGTIPTEFGLLTNVSFLDLTGSYVGGVLPSELGLMTKLETLTIGDCRNLEGTIPPELGTLARRLKTLSLHGTNLKGTLPEEFCFQYTDIYARCDVLTCSCCLHMFCVP